MADVTIGRVYPSRPALLRALPPWLPSPVELAEDSTCRAPGTPPWWVYAAALYATGAAFVAGCVTLALRSFDGVALLAPLAAIAVVCGALPLARAARRALRALSLDTLYGALQWLGPWVTLGWVLPASLDSDGGGGGACAYGSMLAGAFALPVAVPALVAWLWAVRSRSRGATSPAPPRISVALVAAMTLVSLGFIVARPARASLDRLPTATRAWAAEGEHAGERAATPARRDRLPSARARALRHAVPGCSGRDPGVRSEGEGLVVPAFPGVPSRCGVT